MIYSENDKWIEQPVSRVYDYKLIASRLEHLRKARNEEDVDNMTYLLRGGLLRNFGGICDRKLFSHSYLGYKKNKSIIIKTSTHSPLEQKN